ncbi:hypothetical protein ACFE04_027530 [Oxalis oulophora]
MAANGSSTNQDVARTQTPLSSSLLADHDLLARFFLFVSVFLFFLPLQVRSASLIHLFLSSTSKKCLSVCLLRNLLPVTIAWIKGVSRYSTQHNDCLRRHQNGQIHQVNYGEVVLSGLWVVEVGIWQMHPPPIIFRGKGHGDLQRFPGGCMKADDVAFIFYGSIVLGGGLFSFISDGKYIFTSSENDLVQVWNMDDRKVVAWGEGHNSWVSGVAFDSHCSVPNSDDNGESVV